MSAEKPGSPNREHPVGEQPANKYTDPTANVLALVDAAVHRLDDLREAERKLSDAEQRRINDLVNLRAEHAKDIASAEAKRIDSIRQVDVQAVATASERAAAQASVLANQVSTSAETLRVLVAATATTVATQQTAALTPIMERLSLLEKNQYQVQGGAAISTPISAQLADRMAVLERTGNRTEGGTKGRSDMIAWIIAAIAALISIASFLLPHLK